MGHEQKSAKTFDSYLSGIAIGRRILGQVLPLIARCRRVSQSVAEIENFLSLRHRS